MIPVVLPSGQEILIASDQGQGSLRSDQSDEPQDYRDVAFRYEFKDLVDVATEIGEVLREGIEKISPSKASVELSVGIDAKTGSIIAFLADGKATGSIKISLEWSKSDQPKP